MTPSCCAIADPDILAAFDPAVLHHLLTPYRTYFRVRGFTLPKRPGTPLAVAALASAIRQGGVADFPLPLAEALHAIVAVGVQTAWPAIRRAAQEAGIDLQRLAQQDVTPWDLAARLWLTDPDRVRRLQADARIAQAWRCDRWRCDPEDRPVVRLADLDRWLAAWARDLDDILAEHHHPPGTRIWLETSDDRLLILIRHGATLRRGVIARGAGSQRSLLFQPAVTDLLCYDPSRGELGLHLEEPSRWLADALRSTCSAWLFREPHLFYRPCGSLADGWEAPDPVEPARVTIAVRAVIGLAARG